MTGLTGGSALRRLTRLDKKDVARAASNLCHAQERQDCPQPGP
jgi:hypothetical protein